MLSVPIALRYLSVEEFGIFVLLIQVGAYFTLIEIGISSASARLLVDYKDSPNDGRYGSVILTGFCALALQGLLILVIGVLAAPLVIDAIGVPETFTDVATVLLQCIAITSALSLAFRMYSAVLYANKRLDVIHAFAGGNMLFGIAVLAFVLASGGGLLGLIWVFLAQTVAGIFLPALACLNLGLLPNAGHWGRPTYARFRELLSFGKDIFMVNVGTQVLEASQLIIVTRTMGLTAAAAWSVSTKLFTLVYQLVTKVEGTAIVFFAEMMVRGEKEKLADRFRQIYQVSAALAVVALAIMVAINKPFVSVWADPSLAWAPAISALLALSTLLNILTRCSGDLIIHSKKIAAFRYVYFVEATVFVLLALWLSSRFGFYGVLGASIVCLLIFRATYTTWRMVKYFKLPALSFWWTWLKRQFLAGSILLPFVISSPWLISSVPSLWGQLFVAGAWVGLPAAISLVFIAIPRSVRKELASRWTPFSAYAKH